MKSILIKVILITVAFFISACSENNASNEISEAKKTLDINQTMTVYKSPSCGCCGDWIEHIENAGSKVIVEHPNDLSALKDKLNIGAQYRSCHTAVTKQGYVFEGHVPARYIQQFLTNPVADSIGLSVPGMPVGSPGMEVGNKFMPYQVRLLKKDGSSELYALVEDASQQ
jgi:hypothetical protein